MFAVNSIDSAGQIVVARCMQDILAVVDQPERYIRPRERQSLQQIRNLTCLCRVLFEKLEAGWNIEKQVFHQDRRALSTADSCLFEDFAAGNANARAFALPELAGFKGHLRYSSNAGQCLTAKTHG